MNQAVRFIAAVAARLAWFEMRCNPYSRRQRDHQVQGETSPIVSSEFLTICLIPFSTYLCALVIFLGLIPLACLADDQPAATRTFELRYEVKIEGLPIGAEYHAWVPIPPSNDDQSVAIINRSWPATARQTRELKYGNELVYVADISGSEPVTLAMTYRIQRKELRGSQPVKDDATQFLKPDSRVPVGGKSLSLLRGKDLPADQMQLARVLYDVVFDHMRYSKDGVGWGRGDSDWACDSRFGNCSDFHSLFISLARAKNIPAKFEIGYSLPPKRGAGEINGYHCWAKFQPKGQGWLGVDISEASKNPALRDYYFGNLTADRVAFTTGRDLILEPKQDGPAVNFLIAPYIEVGGKAQPAEKVKTKLSYRDEEQVPPGKGESRKP